MKYLAPPTEVVFIRPHKYVVLIPRESGEILEISFLEWTPALFTNSTTYAKIKLAISLSMHSND
jgi:hypothetical protein